MRNRIDLPADVIESIRAWAGALVLVEEVYLFGSRAKNNARPDSDVDLALKMAGPEDEWLPEAIEFLSDWSAALERAIGLAADLQPILSGSRVEGWVADHGVMLYSRRAQIPS